MEASGAALLSEDPAHQSVLYANLEPAAGRYAAVDEEKADGFRRTLEHFCRAYGFGAQVMTWADIRGGSKVRSLLACRSGSSRALKANNES